VEDEAMDFGIFNLMGARDPDKPTAQVFGEVAATRSPGSPSTISRIIACVRRH